MSLDELGPSDKQMREKRGLLVRARAKVRETLESGRSELIGQEAVSEYVRDLRGILEHGSLEPGWLVPDAVARSGNSCASAHPSPPPSKGKRTLALGQPTRHRIPFRPLEEAFLASAECTT